MAVKYPFSTSRKPAHKFKAKAVEEDGHLFPSTLEFNYFKHLELRVRIGEVIFFLRQVPFHLPGGLKYYVDYQIFNSSGTVDFVDVKGHTTAEFLMKKKLVESLYPVEIKVIKKGDF